MNLMFFLFILANIEKQSVLYKFLRLLHFQSPICNTKNTSSMYHKTGYHPTYDKASFYQVDCLSLFENVIQIQHQKLFSVQKP